MATHAPPPIDEYASLVQNFRWSVPKRLNLARVCCERWADDPARVAILSEADDGSIRKLAYAQMHMDASALAHALAKRGVRRGDMIAIVLPQRPEAAIAYVAVHMLGAIAMPLSILFGPDALEYRLNHGEAKAVIVDPSGYENLRATRALCPCVEFVIGLDLPNAPDAIDWRELIATGRRLGPYSIAYTESQEPALLIYTSGTTGNPKGATIPHAAIIGNLPGFVASQNWFPQTHDVFWSPADWAWTGGLWDALMPTLYFGKPIVAGDAKQDGRFLPERAYALMERFEVTNTFLFPTALKAMMKAVPHPRERYALKLRAIMSAGEPVGETIYRYCEDRLDVRVNEMFGQTEVNYIVGNSNRWPARPGSMGRPYPGHDVVVIDDDGHICAPGVAGEVAINRFWHAGGQAHPDPIFFLGYWKNDDATRAKFTGNWCRTGDLATMDRDGYLWYQGRSDDMFKSAGYRIGPAEIENCLLKHPSVAICAVIGKPDPDRTHIVKAFVVLTAGYLPSETLVRELQLFVRGKLAPYEYPKEIEFIDALPMTTTGKVQRRLLRERERERALAK